MNEDKKEKPVQTSVYIAPVKYDNLKVRLIRLHMSFNEWLNKQIDMELQKPLTE